MKERISEIEKASYITNKKKVRKGGWDSDRPPYEYDTVEETVFSAEKFAELIIEECAKISEDCYTYHEPLSKVPDYIKKFKRLEDSDFGV